MNKIFIFISFKKLPLKALSWTKYDMCVHVLVLNVEKYLRTIAVNVIKVLNSALDAIKSY